MSKNAPYYLISIVLFLLLKIGFSFADNDSLFFLLKPTDKVIGIIINSNSIYSNDVGFFHEKLNIIIEKSCSGFSFWILCFIMLCFLALKYYKNSNRKILIIPSTLIVSYVLTIFVNASRIIISIIGQNTADNYLVHKPHTILHDVIGTFIYLFFLIIIYLGFNNLFNKLKQNDEKLT